MATATEVAKLKAQWLTDPSWDIEETEGFEAHRDELRLFHMLMARQWSQERLERWEAKARVLGCPGNILLAQYVERLEARLAALEARDV